MSAVAIPSLSKYIVFSLVAILVCIGLAALKKVKWLILGIIVTVLLLIKTGMIAMVKDYVPPVIDHEITAEDGEVPEKPELDVEIDTPKLKYTIDENRKGFGLDVLDHIDEDTNILDITDNISNKLRDTADTIDSGARSTEEDVKNAVSDALKKARDESNEILQQSNRSAERDSQE